KEAVHALQVSDYARVDIRLPADGLPFVVEVNANPYLEATSETAMAASAAGRDYNTLLDRILNIAWERCERETPLKKAPRTNSALIHKRDKIPVSFLKVLPLP